MRIIFESIKEFIIRCCGYISRFPKRVRWRCIQKKGGNDPVIAKLANGMRARIYPNDTLGELVYVCGGSEKNERMFVSRFLNNGMVFFDVGANFGQYTLLASSLVGDSGQVHSFEPNQRLFQELEYNVQLNSVESICRLNNFAVSETIGTAELVQYGPGAEVFGSLGSHQRKEALATGTETVKTSTIDYYLKDKGVGCVDLVKMDIEGAELLALRGGRQLFCRDNAPVLLVELSDENCRGFTYSAGDIWDYLIDVGYVMYSIDKHGRVFPAERPQGDIDNDFVALKGVVPERIAG